MNGKDILIIRQTFETETGDKITKTGDFQKTLLMASRFDRLKAITSKEKVTKVDTERMNKIASGTLSTSQAKKLVKG